MWLFGINLENGSNCTETNGGMMREIRNFRAAKIARLFGEIRIEQLCSRGLIRPEKAVPWHLRSAKRRAGQ
jgi:hypothetical protein